MRFFSAFYLENNFKHQYLFILEIEVSKEKFEAKILTVYPLNLDFEAPYRFQNWKRFSLVNDYGHDQVFKIKSTQPEAIGVTPRAGFIRANNEIEVMIYIFSCVKLE